MAAKIFIKKMLRYYGETVPFKKRISHDDGDGEVHYTYETQEPVRGQFMQLTGWDLVFNRYGQWMTGDYIGTFEKTVDIDRFDQVYLYDGWYEVESRIDRRTKGTIDYVEVLLRKKA